MSTWLHHPCCPKKKPNPNAVPQIQAQLCLALPHTASLPPRPCHAGCHDRWRQALRNGSVTHHDWFVRHQCWWPDGLQSRPQPTTGPTALFSPPPASSAGAGMTQHLGSMSRSIVAQMLSDQTYFRYSDWPTPTGPVLHPSLPSSSMSALL